MTNIYQLKNVDFYYADAPDSAMVLSNINIEIKTSQIIAIVGPNGSGKTSLLNIFSFLATPKAGTLFFKQQCLKQENIKNHRKQVGYVQQNPYLLRGSAYENIELGLKLKKIDKKIRHRRVNEVIELLQITDLANRTARSLSGGEAQKVAIGQTLVLDPEVLVLDEPFNHLDRYAIIELEQLVRTLNRSLNKTIIFTTHDQIQAQSLADETYSVISGRLFKAGLINLFRGSLDKGSNVFRTNHLSICVPATEQQSSQIAIDPKLIVLSNDRLDSSMQNSFSGKVIGMNEEQDNIKLIIDIGEKIQATISPNALEQLRLLIGSMVWVSFKRSAVILF